MAVSMDTTMANGGNYLLQRRAGKSAEALIRYRMQNVKFQRKVLWIGPGIRGAAASRFLKLAVVAVPDVDSFVSDGYKILSSETSLPIFIFSFSFFSIPITIPDDLFTFAIAVLLCDLFIEFLFSLKQFFLCFFFIIYDWW